VYQKIRNFTLISKWGFLPLYLAPIKVRAKQNFLTLYRELLTFLEPKRPFSQEMAKNREKRIL
jgi:hypothetical protein